VKRMDKIQTTLMFPKILRFHPSTSTFHKIFNRAAQTDDYGTVLLCFSTGLVDIHSNVVQDTFQNAVALERTRIVQLFVSRGIDVNRTGTLLGHTGTPLEWACSTGSAAMVRTLVNANARVSQICVKYALLKRDRNFIEPVMSAAGGMAMISKELREALNNKNQSSIDNILELCPNLADEDTDAFYRRREMRWELVIENANKRQKFVDYDGC
jgi:hypothetical protein